MNEKKIYNWLLLSLTSGVGGTALLKLINKFGDVDAVLDASINDLSQVISVGVAKQISQKTAMIHVEKALIWLNSSSNHHIITLDDTIYPESLAQIASPPPILFAIGNLDLLKMPKIAIVGTRHPTAYGITNATNFARELSNNKLAIVSGMASGIDYYAHKSVLNNTNNQGATIGVLGTGIDQIYPKTNKELFNQMYSNGLLLSEFTLGMNALAQNFPRRNRIVSGLSLGCVVIESTLDGGSMISANLALEMGREVFAIPGSIHNPVARGCHKLIKNGAKLVETANDILEELKFTPKIAGAILQQQNTNDPLLNLIGFDGISIDNLVEQSKIDFAQLCAKLLEYELDGKITNCGNGRYQRIIN